MVTHKLHLADKKPLVKVRVTKRKPKVTLADFHEEMKLEGWRVAYE